VAPDGAIDFLAGLRSLCPRCIVNTALRHKAAIVNEEVEFILREQQMRAAVESRRGRCNQVETIVRRA